MSNRFCESCGAAVSDGSKFCEGCGAEVGAPQVEAAPQAAPAPQPVPQPVPSYNDNAQAPQPPGLPTQKVLIGIGAAVILIVAGYGGWLMLGPKAPTKQDPKPVANQPQDKGKTPPPEVAVTEAGQGFIGRWFPEEADGASEQNNIVTFSKQGSKIVGVSTVDPQGRIELDAGAESKLSGEYVDAKGERTPVTAEILSDGQKMVLTLLPPASEPDTVILVKVKEGEAPYQKGVAESGGSGEVSKDKAEDIVLQLKDVQTFMKSLDNVNKHAIFDTSEEDANTWMVHVYELVDDGQGVSHTATFGWYKVDKKTGKVSPGME